MTHPESGIARLTVTPEQLPADPDEPGTSFLELFRGHDERLTSGLWEAGAFSQQIDAYPVDEVCFLLSGQVTLTDADGHESVFTPGDGFAIRKGTPCTWTQSGPVRKVYVILEGDLQP